MNKKTQDFFRKILFMNNISRELVWPIEAREKDKLNYALSRPFTGISISRAFALIQATRYVVENEIPGDFVEFGVAKGGSAMLVALTLKDMGVRDRDIYLYDLFGSRPKHGEWDTEIESGRSVQEFYDLVDSGDKDAVRNWQFYDETEVLKNLSLCNYPTEKIHLIKGDVCQSLTEANHDQVALMRLDTDFYDSTKHELQVLFPKVVSHGVVIIDDYGHWFGSKKATDEFISALSPTPLMFYIDSTARQFLKFQDSP